MLTTQQIPSAILSYNDSYCASHRTHDMHVVKEIKDLIVYRKSYLWQRMESAGTHCGRRYPFVIMNDPSCQLKEHQLNLLRSRIMLPDLIL